MTRRLVVRLVLAAGALWCAPRPLEAQSGVIAGSVLDADTRGAVDAARIIVDGAQREAITDTAGLYRIRGVSPGWHRVRALRVGYRPVVRDSVLVRAGETALLNIVMQRTSAGIDTLRAIDVTSTPDVILDPLMPSMTQRITGEDLRALPVSSLEEAVQLSAGVVGGSFRGGRLGQEAFILDGLTVKNQLDASTGALGLRFPPDLLTEAAVVTNGFSARYGQVLSGIINVVTKDGGERWSGRTAYESDRFAPESADYGLDRFIVSGDGPLGPARLAVAVDLSGRVDADPVNAPPPQDSLDPRTQRPNILPHNSGEQVALSGKLTMPLGGGHIVRLLGLHTTDQRLLYDPALKYDLAWAPARRVTGTLVSGHWQYATRSVASRSLVSDLRLAYFGREFLRGPQDGTTDPAFGAFTFQRLRIRGEDIARSRDTVAASGPLPGYVIPDWSDQTPYGVPAFFIGTGGRGELVWNKFGELRAQLDMNVGWRASELYFGGEVVRQDVQTFQRVSASQAVSDSVPAPASSSFTPITTALYGEGQLRWNELAFTAGVRWDRFDPRTTAGGAQVRGRSAVSPRLAVSTVLKGATVVVSYGRFAQAPDFQYLVDAAFDDTTRTGRFRAGNPSLGYETATQYEFSVRARPSEYVALRVNAFQRRLDGMVASVPLGFDPDSSIFGNADYGTVSGIEILLEREFVNGWGIRVLYALQKADASASDAFRLFRLLRIAPNGTDTIFPASVEFPLDYDRRHGLSVIASGKVDEGWGPRVLGLTILGGFEGSAIGRYNSGLPFTRTNAAGDSLLGLPNSYRLPSTSTVDLLLRRPFRVGAVRSSVYLDVRNLINKRNIVAVRRDTGTPALGDPAIQAEADRAYQAHPEPIPFESPRYRGWADLNGDGLVSGSELPPLFLAAARDYYQPLFSYGAPRLLRLGFEVIF